MILLQKWIDFAAYGEMLTEEFAFLGFNPDRVLDMLPKMGLGMLVIFVIIAIIILSTVIIQKVFSSKKKD